MAVHKQPFQRFYPERLEAGVVVEGELSQFPVQSSSFVGYYFIETPAESCPLRRMD